MSQLIPGNGKTAETNGVEFSRLCFVQCYDAEINILMQILNVSRAAESGQSCERPQASLSVVIITDQIDIDFETVQAPAAAPGSVPTAAVSLKIRNAWTDLQPGSFLLQFGL